MSTVHKDQNPVLFKQDENSSVAMEKEVSDGEMTEKPPKIPLMKWLIGKELENCECSGGDCRREICPKVDLELLVRQAVTEYLHNYDDRPTLGFREFFKKWLKDSDVRDVLAVAHFFEEKQADASATAPPPSLACPEIRSVHRPEVNEATDSSGQQKIPNIEDLFKEMDEWEANPYEIHVSSLKTAFVHKGRVRADLQPTYILHHSSKDSKKSFFKEKLPRTSQKFYQGLDTILGMDPTTHEDTARAIARNIRKKRQKLKTSQ